MRGRLLVFLAFLIVALPIHADAREITIGFAAVKQADDKPAGHAWVIIAIREDDGKESIRGYGWYPEVGIANQGIPGALRILFGGAPGVGGVPGHLNEGDLIRKGDLYLQKTITESQFAAVEGIIARQRDATPALSYDGFINNCIDFTARVAKAVDLKTPAFYTFPHTFMGGLAAQNPRYLVPLPQPGDNIEVRVSDWWKNIIDQGTNFDNIMRDLRWRAYQANHIHRIQTDSEVVASRRVKLWRAANVDNQKINGTALRNEQAYVDALRREHDRIAGYGGSAAGTVASDGNGGGAGGGNRGGSGGKVPACDLPICIFQGLTSAAPNWQRSVDRAALARTRVDNLSLAVMPANGLPLAALLAGDPSFADEEAVLLGVGSELRYTSLEALRQPFGNSGLLDVGALATGDTYRFRIGFVNRTAHPLDITLGTTGSKLSAQWMLPGPAGGNSAARRIEVGQAGEMMVDFKAEKPELQDLQSINIESDGVRIIGLVVNYLIVPEATQTITVTSGQVLSGLGKRWSGARKDKIDYYHLNAGPAPPLYTVASATFVVEGGHGHRCADPDHRGDQYAKCFALQTNNDDVIRQFTVQGVEGDFFSRDNNVHADATLTTRYMLRRPEAPTLTLIER